MTTAIFRRSGPVIAAGFAVVLAGCSDLGDKVPDDPLGPPPPTVFFATDIQPIFTLNCTGCHGLDGFAGLDLREGVSYGNLVGVTATEIDLPRIDPFALQTSWLYRKITGTQTVGEPMPWGAFPLPEATVALVEQWILEGALDN
jgi:hypothetical protein